MAEPTKRVIPPALKRILEIDIYITNKFVTWVNQLLPLEPLRVLYTALEISCHGIPWIAAWLAFTWIFYSDSLVQMQINMLFGLLLDVIFVSIIKAYTRRRRPTANVKDRLSIGGPDVFSFPSGHASRAFFIAYFFIFLFPVHMIFFMPLLSWATSVSLSRILLNRHHILDVVGGVALGFFEGCLLGLLLLDKSTCIYLLSSLTDERLEGGEYHV